MNKNLIKFRLKFRLDFRDGNFTVRPPSAGSLNLGYASVRQGNFGKIKNQPRITYLDISNRDLGGPADLKGFESLKSLNSYNNKFENLDCLNNLPKKDKLQKINFYGNDIKKIDLAAILTQFPNLQYLNIENNPVSTENLNKLTKDQLKNLVGKIKDKKFRVNSYRGTVLQDLLFFLQNSGHTEHAKEIAVLINSSSESSPARNSGQAGLWLVGGVGIILLGLTLGFGYWWGKKKKNLEDDDE